MGARQASRRIPTTRALTLQVLKSDQMNSFINLSQQYGPGIANQAMAAVSSYHSSSHLPYWRAQAMHVDVANASLLDALESAPAAIDINVHCPANIGLCADLPVIMAKATAPSPV